MRLRTIISVLMSVVALSARAQAPSTASFGLGGASDSLAVKAINEKMAEIRKTRPTVALVLSGGGAKGGAHIGVLKYMKDAGIDIPFDMVLGTSMGGLVGALYSIGYSSDELDSLMRNTDWWKQVGDAVPRENRSLQTVKYREKYMLSFPFYYSNETVPEPEDSLDRHYSPLRLSAEGDASSLMKDNLRRSLPSGFYSGQNVSHLISSLTVGYQDSLDFFTDLPVPFVCVATDLVSAKAKIWHDGPLPIAMRTTMSAPGFFSPVRWKGMFLADGGMRNNFPTDIAREMGADIIIGIDLHEEPRGYDKAHNIGDVVSMTINLLDNDSMERTLGIPDLTIHPDLHEFSATSFSHNDVLTIIERGYEAGKANDEALRAISKRIGPYTHNPGTSRKVDIGQTSVIISGVTVTGVDEKEMQFIKSKIRFRAGDEVNKTRIENAVGVLYGTGYYESVTYELRGETGPYELVIHCRKGPVHRLGVGFRIDSEEVVSLLVNVGLWTNRFGGDSYDLTGKLGVNPYLGFHYAYEFLNAPTINVEASARFVDRNRIHYNGDLFDIRLNQFRLETYLSEMRLMKSDFRIGLRDNFVNLKDILSTQARGDYDYSASMRNYMTAFASVRYDDRDDSYFPKSGMTIGASVEAVERNFDGKFAPFGIIAADWKQHIGITNRWSLIPSISVRAIIGDNIPIAYANIIGGSMDGRYLEQQISFMGVIGAAYRRNYMALGRIDLRYSPLKNNYITATFNYARDFFNFSAFKYGTNAFGAGLEYAYDSIVGPLRFNLHWSNLTRSVGMYVSLGFDF